MSSHVLVRVITPVVATYAVKDMDAAVHFVASAVLHCSALTFTAGAICSDADLLSVATQARTHDAPAQLSL